MALDASIALITLEKAKSFIKIPISETAQDDLVEDFINEASTLINNYCNRKFVEQAFTEYHNGSGGWTFMPRAFPVISITELYDDIDRLYATPLDSSLYAISNDEKGEGYEVERFDCIFTRSRRNVKIVFQGGYANIPYDLQLACKVTMAYYYQKQQQQDWTTATQSKGDEDITLIQGIPESATKLLDKFKRLEILGDDEPVRNR